MSEAALNEPDDAPVWARDDAFPEAPAGWGWIDAKNKHHDCGSLEELAAAIRDDRRAEVVLAWTPEQPRMRVPEEIPGVGESIRAARDRWTREDLEVATSRLQWFSAALVALLAWTFYGGLAEAARLAEQAGTHAGTWGSVRIATRLVISSTSLGIATLIYLIFVFIPWYQARKRRAEMSRWTEEGIAQAVPAMRFETWLSRQKAPVTLVFLCLIGVVWLAQMMPGDALQAAGLIKTRYLHLGENWRLFTAPFLHVNIVHLLMNGAALAYLGKRMEVFARWPHLPLVFLFAATLGGEASARLIKTDSVGASGGLMGWLGFLLVFETLHGRLVPSSSRRRLAAGVFLTAAIGLVGYRFIDNAAHAGGLIAGMVYAAVVFPKSSSPRRPRTTSTDVVAGIAAMAILVVAAWFAVTRIMST